MGQNGQKHLHAVHSMRQSQLFPIKEQSGVIQTVFHVPLVSIKIHLEPDRS